MRIPVANRNFGSVGGIGNIGLDLGLASGMENILDWSAYTPVYNFTGTATNVPASSWYTHLNITGEGVFKWCSAFVNNNYGGAHFTSPTIRITVDGVVYEFTGYQNTGSWVNNTVNVDIPFKQSLKIETYNTQTTTVVPAGLDYLYLLKNKSPNPGLRTVLSQSQRKMGHVGTSNTWGTDVVNVTGKGYLLGAFFTGFYSSGGGHTRGYITIDGSLKMNDRVLFGTSMGDYKQSNFFGPIRFESSLQIQVRTSLSASWAIGSAWYTLD